MGIFELVDGKSALFGTFLIFLAFMFWEPLFYVYFLLFVALLLIGLYFNLKSKHSGNMGAVTALYSVRYLSVPAAAGLLYILATHVRIV